MSKPSLKFFYKIVTKSKEGKYAFSNTMLTIKTENLSIAVRTGIKQLHEAKEGSVPKKARIVYLPHEDYKKIRTEAKISVEIIDTSNDYIGIFNGVNKLLFLIKSENKIETDKIQIEEFEKAIEERDKIRQRMEKEAEEKYYNDIPDFASFKAKLNTLLVYREPKDDEFYNELYSEYKTNPIVNLKDWAEEWFIEVSLVTHDYALKSSIITAKEKLKEDL